MQNLALNTNVANASATAALANASVNTNLVNTNVACKDCKLKNRGCMKYLNKNGKKIKIFGEIFMDFKVNQLKRKNKRYCF